RGRPGALQADLDARVRRAELDGIREKIPDDLLEPIGIGKDRPCIRIEDGLQLDLLRIGDALDSVDCRFDDRDRIDLPALEPELAGNDARYVEEVLDQLRQELGIPLDHLEAARRPGLVLESDAQETGPSE